MKINTNSAKCTIDNWFGTYCSAHTVIINNVTRGRPYDLCLRLMSVLVLNNSFVLYFDSGDIYDLFYVESVETKKNKLYINFIGGLTNIHMFGDGNYHVEKLTGTGSIEFVSLPSTT